MAKITGLGHDLKPEGVDVLTEYVDQDEKVYWLIEATYPAKNFKGKRRFQLIYVNRDDQLAAWVGIVDDNQGLDYPEFRIPSFWEHNVAEVMEMAQLARFDNTLEMLMKEQAENSTLITDFMELALRREAIKANRSVFGAGKTTGSQRIGFHPSREKEETNE